MITACSVHDVNTGAGDHEKVRIQGKSSYFSRVIHPFISNPLHASSVCIVHRVSTLKPHRFTLARYFLVFQKVPATSHRQGQIPGAVLNSSAKIYPDAFIRRDSNAPSFDRVRFGRTSATSRGRAGCARVHTRFDCIF